MAEITDLTRHTDGPIGNAYWTATVSENGQVIHAHNKWGSWMADWPKGSLCGLRPDVADELQAAVRAETRRSMERVA